MIPGSIVESVDKLIANSSEAPATRELVAHVLAELADELPEHFARRTEVQNEAESFLEKVNTCCSLEQKRSLGVGT